MSCAVHSTNWKVLLTYLTLTAKTDSRGININWVNKDLLELTFDINIWALSQLSYMYQTLIWLAVSQFGKFFFVT